MTDIIKKKRKKDTGGSRNVQRIKEEEEVEAEWMGRIKKDEE